MARERMVTRNIMSTEVTCKVYNLKTDELEKFTFTLTGEDNPETIKRTAERTLEKSGLKFIKVLDIKTTEQLYAMKETDFLKYAVKIEKGASRVPERDEA